MGCLQNEEDIQKAVAACAWGTPFITSKISPHEVISTALVCIEACLSSGQIVCFTKTVEPFCFDSVSCTICYMHVHSLQRKSTACSMRLFAARYCEGHTGLPEDPGPAEKRHYCRLHSLEKFTLFFCTAVFYQMLKSLGAQAQHYVNTSLQCLILILTVEVNLFQLKSCSR